MSTEGNEEKQSIRVLKTGKGNLGRNSKIYDTISCFKNRKSKKM